MRRVLQESLLGILEPDGAAARSGSPADPGRGRPGNVGAPGRTSIAASTLRLARGPLQARADRGVFKPSCCCRAHYVEYLAGLARGLDPIPIMDVAELVAELRRRALPLPERGPWDTDPIYAGMCAEVHTPKHTH